MTTSDKPPTIRFGVAIILMFVSLIIGTAGLIGYISFPNGQRAVQKLAQQTLESIQVRVEQDLHNFLSIPHALNRINADILRNGLVNPRNLAEMRRLFLHQIQAFDSVPACAFGSEDVEFIRTGWQT